MLASKLEAVSIEATIKFGDNIHDQNLREQFPLTPGRKECGFKFSVNSLQSTG